VELSGQGCQCLTGTATLISCAFRSSHPSSNGRLCLSDHLLEDLHSNDRQEATGGDAWSPLVGKHGISKHAKVEHRSYFWLCLARCFPTSDALPSTSCRAPPSHDDGRPSWTRNHAIARCSCTSRAVLRERLFPPYQASGEKRSHSTACKGGLWPHLTRMS